MLKAYTEDVCYVLYYVLDSGNSVDLSLAGAMQIVYN